MDPTQQPTPPPADELQQRILDLVAGPTYQPVKPSIIAKQLGLATDDRPAVRRAVKRLVQQGRLSFGPGHQVRAARPNRSNEVVGVIKRLTGGSLVVRPAGVTSRDGDIWIPPRAASDAMHGDTVRVKLRGRPAVGDRTYGQVVEVLERERRQFVATISQRNGQWLAYIDGRAFADPLPLPDAEAKGARSKDKVVVEIVRFPTAIRPGEAVLLEILGQRGQPGVDTLSILREYHLIEEFPADALETARRQADAFDETIGPDRLDLTEPASITIDPVDARDFDDAISLILEDNGHWRLSVHIADVAHFVPAGSPLDAEARKRGTSVYLPDRVIPMLPEIISNHLASLQPDKVRYTHTVMIEFTPDGAVVGASTRPSAIRSKRRFSYEEVDQYLADPEAWRGQLAPDVHALLGRMHRLAMILRRRRLEHGAIELTLPEVKIELDASGRVSGAKLVENTESHQVIEEFMLAANQAVAQLLHDRGWLALRRVHEPPDRRKLQDLTEFVRSLGIRCGSLDSRFEILKVIREAAGRPEERAVHFAVLRSMRKALYAPSDEGHYALNMTHYCHFTSPIRRYPDLTLHRLLSRLEQAAPRQPGSAQQLEELGRHCSLREQRAEAAERELIKLKLLLFLNERIGEKMKAVITGVEEFGLFAQGIELPAEGLIPAASLRDDHYRFDSATRSLTGFREGKHYQMGDLVEVEVRRIDLQRRLLEWALVKRLHQAAGPAKPRSNSKPKSKSTRTDPRAEKNKPPRKGSQRPPKKGRPKR